MLLKKCRRCEDAEDELEKFVIHVAGWWSWSRAQNVPPFHVVYSTGVWGAFCINHLAIARTKKNTLTYWPSPKVAHLQDQTDEPLFFVFTSWIGKCFSKFFGEKHEPRVSWLFKSLVDITADRCFLIIITHIKTNGRVFRLHLITPFFRIKNGNSFSPAIYIYSPPKNPSKHRSFTMGFQNTIGTSMSS